MLIKPILTIISKQTKKSSHHLQPQSSLDKTNKSTQNLFDEKITNAILTRLGLLSKAAEVACL